jgi:hypothetical protein
MELRLRYEPDKDVDFFFVGDCKRAKIVAERMTFDAVIFFNAKIIQSEMKQCVIPHKYLYSPYLKKEERQGFLDIGVHLYDDSGAMHRMLSDLKQTAGHIENMVGA